MTHHISFHPSTSPVCKSSGLTPVLRNVPPQDCKNWLAHQPILSPGIGQESSGILQEYVGDNKALHMVILHPRATSASSIRDYMRLCSIICTYQTFEVLALDGEISDFQPPILLLSPLAFPKSNQDSSSITVCPLMYIFSLS